MTTKKSRHGFVEYFIKTLSQVRIAQALKNYTSVLVGTHYTLHWYIILVPTLRYSMQRIFIRVRWLRTDP